MPDSAAPRWLPIVGAATLLALAALLFGTERVIELAVQRMEPTFAQLPAAAGWSLLRMTCAYVASLIFAWIVGYAAATSARAARAILPLLDVAQSVPVLGFFPAAIYLFVTLLGGGRLSLELASIFLIFTSQTWNLAFAVYEGLSTIPAETRAAVDSLGVQGVLRWRSLLLPTSVPTLLYNSILSWSNGWYFLIACEIIVSGKAEVDLPGLGSLLARALAGGDLALAMATLGTLIGLVVALELLIWRPLRAWSVRFRYDTLAIEEEEGTVVRLPDLGIPALIRPVQAGVATLWSRVSLPDMNRSFATFARVMEIVWRIARWPLLVAAIVIGGLGIWAIVQTLRPPWPPESRMLPLALLLSFLRITAAYVLSLAWIIPVALWASDHPKGVRTLSLVAQIGASIPATAFFPVLVSLLVDRFGGMELISIALAMTGMQWYLLFNVLAGVQRVPQDLREVLTALGVPPQGIHRELVLPACMPSLVTGSLAAWGGAWNALILSEYVVYRGRTYEVLGIGAMLNKATFESGSRSLLFMSLALIVVTVVTFNNLVWGRLYRSVGAKYRLEG